MPVPLTYNRRQPEKSTLYGIVLDYLEEFLQTADTRSGNQRSLPRYVVNAFRRYLRCGILAHGFVRVRCRSCGYEGLVAFSCKERGICPSCAGRRMAETAAHLTDRVFPRVPVRQWVLTMPWDIRFLLARDAGLLAAADNAFVSEMFRHYRRQAWVRRAAGAFPGAVTAVQRFGGALNLNIHFHTIFLDGVYREDPGTGGLGFLEAPPPTEAEMDRVLWRARDRIHKLLERRGHRVDPDAPPALDGVEDESSLFEHIQSGSVRSWSCLEGKDRPVLMAGSGGVRAGAAEIKPLNAVFRGWSLNAAVRIQAEDREGVERVCRYVLRPPLAEERLKRLPDGRILYRFRHPKPNGDTCAVFTPVEFLEKLAALVPPPRAHLVRYHGILAPNHRKRSKVVPAVRPPRAIADCNRSAEAKRPSAGFLDRSKGAGHDTTQGRGGTSLPRRSDAKAGAALTNAEPVKPPDFTSSLRLMEAAGTAGVADSSGNVWSEHDPGWRQGRPHLNWAQLLKRSMDIDALKCPKCGEKMTMISVIEDPEVIRKILTAMKLPAEAPLTARAPPPKDGFEIVQDSIYYPAFDEDEDVA